MKKLKMRNNTDSGILVTFCGLDGCGKTTMINRLVSEFESNYSIVLTKQPTPFVRNSDIFRTYMDTPNHDDYEYRSLSLLAASDRVQHVSKVIAPELKKGNFVISDRYYYSCLANLRARGYKKDRWIYEIAESIVKPDIAFFLDTSVEKAVERVRSREEEKNRYIDMDLQYRLRDEYIKICKKSDGIMISTDQSEDRTFAQIMYEIYRMMERKERSIMKCCALKRGEG